MKYVDASVTVIVIVPATASTFKLYTVEYKVLAEPTNIVTVGLPVKMKLPPAPERNEVDETIDTVIVADELKMTLCPGVVIELPEHDMAVTPLTAPTAVRPVAADVIVDEIIVMSNVFSVEANTMLSDAVAVKIEDDKSDMPTLVALDANFTLFAPDAVNLAAEVLISTTFAEDWKSEL